MQHSSQGITAKAAERTAEEHLGACGHRSQHSRVTPRGAGTTQHLATALSDGKVGARVGIGTPHLPVGGSSPEGLVGTHEGVLRQRSLGVAEGVTPTVSRLRARQLPLQLLLPIVVLRPAT